MTANPDPSQKVQAAWQALLGVAMLGTQRQTNGERLLPWPLSGELGRRLEAVPQDDPQHALLCSAAVLAAYRQAGSLPTRTSLSAPEPCPADERPVCSLAAARRLARLLSGERPVLISEWLDMAARAGKRAAEELLPALLEYGKGQLQLSQAWLEALGIRGRWLAAHNPQWEYAVAAAAGAYDQPSPIENIWSTGSRDARRWLLRAVRQRDPAFGRVLVESTWREDSAPERAAFLAEFESGLGMEDEPFLENCLDDRSKDVRRTAAMLLSNLPDARLVQRMVQRIQPLLRYEAGRWPLRKGRLVVTLPEVCDAAMLRDGIASKPAKGQGEKAGWLQEMLAAVPPSTWNKTLNLSTQEIFHLALESEWKETLLSGWMLAAQRFRDSAWINAFLGANTLLPGLFQALPDDRQEAFVTSLLQNNRLAEAVNLYTYSLQPWRRDLSIEIIRNLRKYYERQPRPQGDHDLRTLISWMENRLDPQTLPEAVRYLSEKEHPGSSWETSVTRLLESLAFRLDMAAEFQTTDGV